MFGKEAGFFESINSLTKQSINKMKQLLFLHVGQAGSQMGASLWENLVSTNKVDDQGNTVSHNQLHDKLFFQSSKGNMISRSICCDLQPSVLDGIKKSKLKSIFASDSLISGKQDSSSIYTMAHYCNGKEHVQKVLDSFRRHTERCQSFQGVILTRAGGGGTGSGFADLILQRLSVEYPKKTKMNFMVVPSAEMANNIVQPYNMMFCMPRLRDYCDISVFFTNQTLYRLNADSRESFKGLNDYMSKIISQTAMSVIDRTSLAQVGTNLIPYPTISCLTAAHSSHEDESRVGSLTDSLFSKEHRISTSTKNINYISNLLIYKGALSPKQIIDSVRSLKTDRKIRTVNWCHTGFKVVLQQAFCQGIQATALSNGSGIYEYLDRLNHKFDLMYGRRAFVHWFSSYMCQDYQFVQSRECSAALQKDLEQVQFQQDQVSCGVQHE